jgi:hypothetical protein
MLDDNKKRQILKIFLGEQRILQERIRTCNRYCKSNTADDILLDIINAKTYWIFSEQSIMKACVTDKDRIRLRTLNLSEADIESVDRLVQDIIGKPAPRYPVVRTMGASRPYAQTRQIYSAIHIN